MKKLEQYFGTTGRTIYQPTIVNETPVALPNRLMPTIVTDTGATSSKIYTEMTYLKKKNIDESICQKLRKIDEYDTDMHKIYNLFVSQTNEQL